MVLALSPIYDDFSSKSISKILKGIMEDMEIEENKIQAVVTDDGGAAPKIHQHLNLEKHICSAHRLQTVIRKSIDQAITAHPNLGIIIIICKKFVRKYKTSNKLRKLFSKNHFNIKTIS